MVKVGDEALGGRVTKITALNEGLEVQLLVPYEPVEEVAAEVAEPVVEEKAESVVEEKAEPVAEKPAAAKAAATKAVRK